MTRPYVLACSLVLASACSPGLHDHFDRDGFESAQGAFRIDYVDAASFRILGEDWRVENYALDAFERPIVADPSIASDLVLHHRRNHGRIWIDGVFLGAQNERTELRMLADDLVAGIARTGYYGSGDASTEVAATGRSFAARILDRRDIGVGGAPGHAIFVDFVDVAQTEVTPDERSARALIVFVRNPNLVTVRRGFDTDGESTLIVAGYANSPAEFDAGLDAFVAFLGSVEFVGRR